MSATNQTIQANGTKGLFAYIDKLGLVIAAIGLSGLLLPFANFRANRIVQGEPRYLLDALPTSLALLFAAVIAAGLLIGFVRNNNSLRLFTRSEEHTSELQSLT
jgi:osmoprotectant transport system permease protein